MGRDNTNVTHGQGRRDNKTKEYRAWTAMKTRCINRRSDQKRSYLDRGITVCERWQNSFESFFADVGKAPSPKHSLDRINNDGHYEPANVRWATKLEQMANTRRNHLVTFNGRTQHIQAWARELKIRPATLVVRLNTLKWSPERALTTPVTNGKCTCGRCICSHRT